MTKCIFCNEQKIFNQKRLLCKSCYQYLLENNQLPEITDEMKLAWRKANLIKKHGGFILSDLELTAKIDAGFSLSDLAKKYGFSREYARQIFINIHGYPYTKVDKMKRLRRLENMITRIKSNDPELINMYQNNYTQKSNQSHQAECVA